MHEPAYEEEVWLGAAFCSQGPECMFGTDKGHNWDAVNMAAVAV